MFFIFFNLQREDWQEVKAQHIQHYENIQLPVPLVFFGRARPFQVETVGYLLESSLKKLKLARVKLNLAKTQRCDVQFWAETNYSYCSKINQGFLAKSSLPPPKCFLRLRAKGRYIVGCYMLRLFTHPVACCWMLLRVAA